MRENLLATLLLLKAGFIDKKVYCDLLDHYFSKDVENSLLCELEWSATKIDVSVNLLRQSKMLNKELFIKSILNTLEKIYHDNVLSLNDFTNKGYLLWDTLPIFREEEPLEILGYAGDPLNYGDEKRCREFLNDIFTYYD